MGAATRGRGASARPAECGVAPIVVVVVVVVVVGVAPPDDGERECCAGLLRRPQLTAGLLRVEGLLRRAAEELPEGLLRQGSIGFGGLVSWATLCGRAGVVALRAPDRDAPLHEADEWDVSTAAAFGVETSADAEAQCGPGGSVVWYAARAAELDVGGRDDQLEGRTGSRGCGIAGSESAC
jgi:hypothetical protein